MGRGTNMKILVIVLTCLLGVGAALGASWFAARKAIATTAIRDAEAALGQGEHEKAVHLFSKALRHRDYADSVDLILRLTDAQSRIPVTEARDAWIHIDFMWRWLQRATQLNPYDQQAFVQLMAMLTVLGRDVRDLSKWDQMYSEADSLLNMYADHGPAIKYRGIAQVNRMAMAATNLMAEDRTQAANDLRTSVAVDPNDRESLLHLAWWYVLEAGIVDRLDHDSEKGKQLRDEAAQLTRDAHEAAPEDPQRLLDYGITLMRLYRWEELEPIVEQIVDQLSAHPGTPQMTKEAVEILAKLETSRDAEPSAKATESPVLERAISLVQAAVEKHTQSTVLRVMLGRLKMIAGDAENAKTTFEEAWRMPQKAGSLEFLVQRTAWGQAGLHYLALDLDGAMRLKIGPEKDKRLEAIENRLGTVRSELGKVDRVSELAGRIHLARNDPVKAAQEFEVIVEREAATGIGNLLRLARSQEKLGEWGAAAESLIRVLRQSPNLIGPRQNLAQIYLNGQMLDNARQQIELLQDQHPSNAGTRLLEAQLFARQNDLETADKIVAEVDLAAQPELAGHVADLYAQTGRADKAFQHFHSAFQKDPTNLPLLAWLMRLTPTREQQLQFIVQSREAGGDPDVLDQFTQYVQGELGLDEDRPDDLMTPVDPVAEAFLGYQQFMEEGNRKAARKALAGFKSKDFKGTMLIWQIFQTSLALEDWKTAERMAAHAREAGKGSGADNAAGLFYLGRLNMARGNAEQAVANFRAGLEKRRTFSRGWRMLGEALTEIHAYNDAIEAFDTALRQKPDSVRALLGKASAHNRRGEYAEALRLLRRAYEYDPHRYEIVDVYLQYELKHGRKKTSLELRQTIAEEDPDNLANRRALARTLAEMGRFRESEQVIDELVSLEGPTLSNLSIKADVLRLAGESDRAVATLMRYIQTRAGAANVEEYLVLAREFIKMGQHQRAIRACREAVKIENPVTRPATRILARQLVRTQDGLSEGLELYRQLWEADPLDLTVAYDYTIALLKADDLRGSESVLKEIVAAHGYQVATLSLSAQIAAKRQQTDKAVAELDRAIALAPQRANLYLAKASLLKDLPNRQSEALNVLDHALRLDPLLSEAQIIKVKIYKQRGETTAAMRECETLLRRHPRLREIRLKLADLYELTNADRQLKTLLLQSQRMFPDDYMWTWRIARFHRKEGRIHDCYKTLLKLLKRWPSQEAVAEKASLEIQLYRPQLALKTLDDHRSVVDLTPLLQAMRGRALLALQQRDRGLAHFRKALLATQNLRDFIEIRDQILLAIDHVQAKAMIRKVFGGNPLPVWIQLGLCDLDHRSGYHYLAVGCLRELESDIEDQLLDSQIIYWETYATALHLTDDYVEAEKAYRRLLELHPHDTTSMNNLAYLLIENRDKIAEGVALALAALGRQPNNPLILDTAGWGHLKVGQITQAREFLEKSVKILPNPSNCLHLAEVLLAEDQESRATNLLKQALELAEQVNDPVTRKTASRRLTELSHTFGFE